VRDPRLTTLADVLCRYSLEVGEGDTVLIDGPPLAQPLFVELVRKVTELGAHPMVRTRLERVQAAFLAEAGDAQLRAVTRLDEIEIEAPTRALSIWGQRNNRFASGIDANRQAIRSAALVATWPLSSCCRRFAAAGFLAGERYPFFNFLLFGFRLIAYHYIA